MEIELIFFLLLFNFHLAKLIRTYMLFLFSCTYVTSLSYSVNFIWLIVKSASFGTSDELIELMGDIDVQAKTFI